MLVEEKLLINAEAIRDTAGHDSLIHDIRWCGVKSLIVENSLNQTVTLAFYGSRNSDMSNAFLKTSFDVTATTNMVADCSCYFPYMRITATCASSPASGTLTIAAYALGE